jgi:hypothetical protein
MAPRGKEHMDQQRELDETDLWKRLEEGAWPRSVQHAVRKGSSFYDYDRVVLEWSDGTTATYRLGTDRTGYGDSKDIANETLSAYARGHRRTGPE